MSTIEDLDVGVRNGAVWPGVRAVIAARRAELFESQVWRPGCLFCGEQAPTELAPAGASAWWSEHQAGCAARAAA